MTSHEVAYFACLVECTCGRVFCSDISEGDARTQMYEHQEQTDQEEVDSARGV